MRNASAIPPDVEKRGSSRHAYRSSCLCPRKIMKIMGRVCNDDTVANGDKVWDNELG